MDRGSWKCGYSARVYRVGRAGGGLQGFPSSKAYLEMGLSISVCGSTSTMELLKLLVLLIGSYEKLTN